MKIPRCAVWIWLGWAWSALAADNDWPSWRGPNGDGTVAAEDASAYPLEWSPEKNLRWRIALPGPSNASPVVSGDRLFLIQNEDEGRQRSLLCFRTEDGTLQWKRTVRHEAPEPTHRTNPHGAASPVTDGALVFAWHGNAGLHAFDLDGTERWSRDLGSSYAHIWGPNAASPVLFGDTLVLHAGPGPEVALFGIDKRTGEIRWRTDLPDAESRTPEEFKGSWATPVGSGDGTFLLGLPGRLAAFDAATGQERWRVAGLGDLCYTNALAGNGRALYLCGYGGPGMAVRLPETSERGDLTATHRLWVDPPKGRNQNPQRIGSGQLLGPHWYLVNEPGVLQCAVVDTGEILWRERIGTRSWSSLNRIGANLYASDSQGTTHVIAPSPEGLRLLARNPVDAGQHTNSSLAFARGRIYLRTDAFLYAFGER
jgi:outer membrane protein assembly factor BamB